MRTTGSSPRRRLGLFAGTISILLIGSLLVAGPAPALTACADPPEVIPVEQLTPGTLGSGVTALAGTTPVPFTFQVVGTIPNGYMLGLDAIVIHITGPQSFLDETGGVFFGMSGSPAYVNGKLAGAVSAVFDDPTFGAVTPAAAMLDVLGAAEGSSARPAQTIVPTPEISRAIARIQGVAPSAVTGTFEQLPLPLAVSGLSDDQVGELQARLDDRGERFVVYPAGSAPTGSGSVSTTPFVPGEPLGVAIAYGDASYYATGTATFMCGDYVTAFGHPFFYDAPGAISLGLSGAEGLMMVRGQGWPGYRFALITEPRGTIVQDRFAGIAGIVGQAPTTSVPIVSTLENLDTGASRTGTTEAIHTWGWWIEELVWGHLSANFAAVFGRYGGGSSGLEWTIRGTLGEDPFTVSNHTMTSDEWDMTGSMWTLISAIDMLQFNEWDDVTFTEISTTGWLTEDLLEGTIDRVRVASSTQPALRARETVKAHPGDVVTVQVRFDMLEGDDVVTTVEFEVPMNVRGTRDVLVRGGNQRYPWPDSPEELIQTLNGGEHPDDLVLTGFAGRQQWSQGLEVGGKHRFWVQIVR